MHYPPTVYHEFIHSSWAPWGGWLEEAWFGLQQLNNLQNVRSHAYTKGTLNWPLADISTHTPLTNAVQHVFIVVYIISNRGLS